MPQSHTYEIDARTRRTVRWLMAVPLLVGVAGTMGQLTGVIYRSLQPIQMFFVDTWFVLLFLLACESMSRTVTLTSDTIQVTGWLSNRVLRRDQIRARRIAYGGKQAAITIHVLIPADRGQRELKLPPFLRTDQTFRSWLNSIPKVDVR